MVEVRRPVPKEYGAERVVETLTRYVHDLKHTSFLYVDPARGMLSEFPPDQVGRGLHLHQSIGAGALEDHARYASSVGAAARWGAGGGPREAREL